MYTDPEALARHKFHECSPACTPRWSQALVNVAPGSAEPCGYCAKYAASRCLGVDDFPNQELLQQQRRRELEAQQAKAVQPPPPAPPAVRGSSLVMAIDEGDMPYYYFAQDAARTLACKQEVLDPSVSNPEWTRDPPAGQLCAAEDVWPPERSEYDLGERGQRAYRRARAQWYREHTGNELAGTIAQQNEQWDNYKRNFRARGSVVEPEREAQQKPEPEREPAQSEPHTHQESSDAECCDSEFAEYARDCGF
jgi:hypothetical protein